MLKQVAKALRSTARNDDVVARLGGDEFAVLLEETDQEGARAFLTRAREQLATNLTGRTRKITTSVGGVTFATPPADVPTLVRKADTLMYAAKSAGKDRFHLELVRDSHVAGAA